MTKVILTFICSLVYYPQFLSAQTLNVLKKSGVEGVYGIDNLKTIRFSSVAMSIAKSSGGADSYNLSDLRNLHFTNYKTGLFSIPSTQTNLIVYPNPATDKIFIQYSEPVSNSMGIKIYSIEGKLLAQKEGISHFGSVTEIDLSDLSKGIYICQISDGNFVQSVKFIIE